MLPTVSAGNFQRTILSYLAADLAHRPPTVELKTCRKAVDSAVTAVVFRCCMGSRAAFGSNIALPEVY